MKVTTIESRAKKIVKEWSPRLGLEDWDIVVRATDSKSLTRDAHMSNVTKDIQPLGCCHASAVDMSAVILLMIVPLVTLAFFLRRYIISGLLAGSVKG